MKQTFAISKIIKARAAVAALLLDFLKNRCSGGNRQPCASVVFRDQAL